MAASGGAVRPSLRLERPEILLIDLFQHGDSPLQERRLLFLVFLELRAEVCEVCEEQLLLLRRERGPDLFELSAKIAGNSFQCSKR